MRQSFFSLILWLSIALPGLCAEDCRLVSGNIGSCVPIRSCKVLIQLINSLQKPLPGDVGLLLRESFFCGHKAGQIMTCCPLDGIEPEENSLQTRSGISPGHCSLQHDKPATCVSYDDCFPFTLMLNNLRKPFPPAVPKIMKEVFLCGTDTATGIPIPKICCPTDALSSQKLSVPEETKNVSPEEEVQSKSTTTTTQAPAPWYKTHPGFKHLGNLETCGRSFVNRRIVGGEDAELGQYPWLINIGYSVSGDQEKVEYKCGGSLIGPRHILTAAHCVTGLPGSYKFSRVRVGEYDLSKEKEGQPDCDKDGWCAPLPQDFTPEQVITHPEYNKPNRFQNDIAIVKLDGTVIENDYVSPVCLPFNEMLPEELKNDPEVAGWGAIDIRARRFADVLQYVPVPFYDSQNCSNLYKLQRVKLSDSQLCAGGGKGKDSCAGDSGSALMLEVVTEKRPYDPRVTQVGVVSFGPRRCASKGVPAIYTKVEEYLHWILDVME